MEMHILEEENYANVQQKFNTSTCSVCNKDATDSIYLAENVTFKYITDARSYRHTSFIVLLKRKASTHVLIVRVPECEITVGHWACPTNSAQHPIDKQFLLLNVRTMSDENLFMVKS